ncbi:MAG: hypothetical protein ABH887_01085 [bacterium]
MLESMCGYLSDLLPFSEENVLTPEKAWEKVEFIIMPEVAEDNKKYFFKSYIVFYNALLLLRERYQFYLQVLERNTQVMDQFAEKMGDILLNERIVFAMHHCFTYGQKMSKTLEDIIKEFPAECLKHFNKRPSIDVGQPMTDCKITGICVCLGKKPPYMHSCLVGNLSGLMRDKQTQDKQWDEVFGVVGKAMDNHFKSLER